jgi:hypothetical protein
VDAPDGFPPPAGATGAPGGWLAICARPSCQPRCSDDMVWRISAGLGPGDPPVRPVLATVVRRGGGLSRS